MQELLAQIHLRQDTRRCLIKIKELLKGKDGENYIRFLKKECEALEDFKALLSDEDAKVRKNTARILGELAVPEMLQVLWETYLAEKTRFVRSAYLEALRSFDYRALLPAMKEQQKQIEAIPIDEENRKHLQEEKMLLRGLIAAKEQRRLHRFKGDGIPSELVLTTNRNHKHVVLEALGTLRKKEFNAGVMVQTKEPSQLLEIRTFEEMFFVLPGCGSVQAEPVQAAVALSAGGLVSYLDARHEKSEEPYVFRIELRSQMTLEQKSTFVRKMAMHLEEETKGRMVNAVSDYDIEIRLVESRQGDFNVLLKFFTLKDYRFAYRRKNIAAGMRPVGAALAIALAASEFRTDLKGKKQPFFRENALVLDPFCGTGTMLIERHKYGKTREMFGLDIYSDAVEAARYNSQLADCKANYIHRDFFTFTSDRLFDEVITDMPFYTGESWEKQEELSRLYQGFFERIPKLLAQDAVMLLYTHDRALVKKYAGAAFRTIKEFELSMKEGSYLFLLERMAL